MSQISINDLVVGINGAGDLASAVACRLYNANIKKIYMMELDEPLALRRTVSFSEAIYNEYHAVEGIIAQRVESVEGIYNAWRTQKIAVLSDPTWKTNEELRPDVAVDAIIAKKNLGTKIEQAPLVIGLGPGFTANMDVHYVIETKRGHNLGRVIYEGSAAQNTGIPGLIGGYTIERVLKSPAAGIFRSNCTIGDTITEGDVFGMVGDTAVKAQIDGIIRGIIRPGIEVSKGLKLGDIDPRKQADYCNTISDKGRAVAGAVLETILMVYNTV